MVDSLQEDSQDESKKQYNKSQKGRLAQERYSKSEAGRTASKNYLSSEKGKIATLKYHQGTRTNQRKAFQETNKILKAFPGTSLEDVLGLLKTGMSFEEVRTHLSTKAN